MEVGTEVRIKTPNYPLSTAEVGEVCLQASDAISKFFGPEYQLPSNWVKRITIKGFPRLHLSAPKEAGFYQTRTRDITLFSVSNSGKIGSISTLDHEIGHAFHHSLIEKEHRKGFRTINHVSAETFADWIETIIRLKGDIAFINNLYKGRVKPENRIFEPGQYLSNEALIHFIYKQWGLKTVLNVVEQMPKPVTKRERVIDSTLSTIALPGVILLALTRIVPYNEYLGRLLTSNRRAYHRFENFVRQNLGMGIEELSREAIQWYQNLDQKPVTLGPNRPKHYLFPRPPKFSEGPRRPKLPPPR